MYLIKKINQVHVVSQPLRVQVNLRPISLTDNSHHTIDGWKFIIHPS